MQFLTSSFLEAESEPEPKPDSDTDPDPTLNSDQLYRIRTCAGARMILKGRSGRIQNRVRKTKHSESTTKRKIRLISCKKHVGFFVLSDLLPWTDSLGLQLNLGPVMPVLQLAQSPTTRVLHDVFNAHMLVLDLGNKREIIQLHVIIIKLR